MTNVRSWKQISKPAATLGGQSDLRSAVSTKAVWWDLRLAGMLTHLLIIWFKSLPRRITHNNNSKLKPPFRIFSPPDLLCVLLVAFKHFCSLYQVIRLSSRKNVNKYFIILFIHLTHQVQLQ